MPEAQLRRTFCKDCDAEGVERTRKSRVANHPGPRCTTHHRLFVKVQKARNHARHILGKYGLEFGQYEKLYASQGGKCAICSIATGKTKRLAVDHDHVSGFVRGLLCGPCNQQIGIWNEHVLSVALNYLQEPPAFHVIGRVKA